LLLVDDEYATQFYIKRLLEKQGYEVTVAQDGEEALTKLEQNEYDCVLMDVQMPVLDGVEATKRIRSMEHGARSMEKGDEGIGQDFHESLNSSIPASQNARMPIIALTAYAMTGDKEKFLEAGMDDYIAKPVDKDELLEVIERNMFK